MVSRMQERIAKGIDQGITQVQEAEKAIDFAEEIGIPMGKERTELESLKGKLLGIHEASQRLEKPEAE